MVFNVEKKYPDNPLGQYISFIKLDEIQLSAIKRIAEQVERKDNTTGGVYRHKFNNVIECAQNKYEYEDNEFDWYVYVENGTAYLKGHHKSDHLVTVRVELNKEKMC